MTWFKRRTIVPQSIEPRDAPTIADRVKVILSTGMPLEKPVVRLKMDRWLQITEDALVNLGASSTPFVMNYIEGRKWDFQSYWQMRAAARAIQRIGNAEMFDTLAAILKRASSFEGDSAQSEHRQVLLRAVVRISRDAAADILVTELCDRSIKAPCSALALSLLTDIGDSRAIPYLLPKLRTEWTKGNDAIQPLLQLGWKPDNPDDELYAALAQRDWESIRQFGERAREPIKELLRFREAVMIFADLSGEDATRFFLSKLGERGVNHDAIIDQLSESDEPTVVVAISDYLRYSERAWVALAKTGDPQGVGLMLAMFDATRAIPERVAEFEKLVQNTAKQLDDDLLRRLEKFHDRIHVIEEKHLPGDDPEERTITAYEPIDCSRIRAVATAELSRRTRT